MLVVRFVISELPVRFVNNPFAILDARCATASLALPLRIEIASTIETESVIVTYFTILLEAESLDDIDSDIVLNVVITLASVSESVIADSVIALIADFVLATESLNDTESVISLIPAFAIAKLSCSVIDSDIVLNDDCNLAIESLSEIVSAKFLTLPETLATASDNEIDGSVIDSVLCFVLATESVIWCERVTVSNNALSNNTLSNSVPKS